MSMKNKVSPKSNRSQKTTKKRVRNKYLRTCDEVEENRSMHYFGLGDQPGFDIRQNAIKEVFRRIPENDYKELDKIGGEYEFQWYVPRPNYLGGIIPCPVNVYDEKVGSTKLAPYAKVLFLSPILENEDFDIAVAVVAHELAHIVLRHRVNLADPKTYNAQEKAAWDQVIKWGFKKEERKHRERKF